jgi:lysophospholipase L1-like esterase
MASRYLALGDSMSIDAYAGGPGRGAASLLLRNRDGDFPDFTGRDLAARGYTGRLLARDGATSQDVRQHQLPLIDAVPDVVTLTAGGNDVLQAYGDSAAARAAIGAVTGNVEVVLGTLRRITRSAPIVVTTVYDPSDGTGAVPGLPPWPGGLAMIAALNDALRDLAAAHGALVAEVHRRFLGHGIAAGDPGQPDSRPASADLWYCDVIEPNAWGAHAIRAVWWETLA